MPRISPRVLWQASHIDRALPRLLPICRDLRSAQNELKWLRDYANKIFDESPSVTSKKRLFDSLITRRASGEPLQYILGSEFFGELEIQCRPGVLIPRQDTAASVAHLVQLLSNHTAEKLLPDVIHVLDLCTGTGCIPLLFQHEFYSQRMNGAKALHVVGVDVSAPALALAGENLRLQINDHSSNSRNLQSLQTMRFLQADVLCDESSQDPQVASLHQALQRHGQTSYDILISNPPYISSRSYRSTTYRSVRDFEPKLALVPPITKNSETLRDGDLFYPHLIRAAERVGAKIVLFEVADLDQAKRVASMAAEQNNWDGIEMWRDEPSSRRASEEEMIGNRAFPVLGEGHGRSVLLYRGVGKAWLGR